MFGGTRFGIKIQSVKYETVRRNERFAYLTSEFQTIYLFNLKIATNRYRTQDYYSSFFENVTF